MPDRLEQLAKRRAKLLADLDKIRDDLAAEIRAQAASGRPRMQIVKASGYGYEQVRQILDPKQREIINKRRRKGSSA